MRYSKAPNAVLSTVGLGSCLAVTCYDPVLKGGALLHTMLADSRRHQPSDPPTAMYLDLGLPEMIHSLVRIGSDVRRMEFKVFGGAHLIQPNAYFSIGTQNVEMMKHLVTQHSLNVTTWDVGGQCNRSVELYLATGRVLLRRPSQPEEWR